ncbi:type VII secretion protein EccCa [Catenulispora pinisilvae]|uniref:type VII secretion protein EccCa n=1 Tax=Catenulispora pinisilvae TaxID=2705253 RepID=UPI00189141D2
MLNVQLNFPLRGVWGRCSTIPGRVNGPPGEVGRTLSIREFRPIPRRPAPALPQGEIAFQEPPAMPEPVPGGLGQAVMVLPMAASSGAMAMMFLQPGARPTNYLAGGMMAFSSLGMVGMQLGRGGGQSKFKLVAERRDYLRHLDQIRRQVRKHIDSQIKALTWRHPDPAALWSVAMSGRLWERGAADLDFAEVRLATGPMALAVRMAPPETKPIEDLDPVSANALRRFLQAYKTVPDLPIAANLRAFARVALDGDGPAGRAVVRALLTQLAVFHGPQELRIAVHCDDATRERWEWVKWLPHALHSSESDAVGRVRLISDSYADLERLLDPGDFRERGPHEASAQPTSREPFTVILLDGGELPGDHRALRTGYRNAVLLDLTGAAVGPDVPVATLRLRATRDGGQATLAAVTPDRAGGEDLTPLGRAATLSTAEASAAARILAPVRVTGAGDAGGRGGGDISFTGLLGIRDARALDPEQTWQARPNRERLRVPLGRTEQGLPAELDIKEAAQGGTGPHGMIIGATGSGKSELLRTLVLAMAVRNDPEILNFVLVDFKGGATFLGLDKLPHTSAVITNLADELPLVKRMYTALHGEMVRRQELLRSAGNYASLRDYEAARDSGVPLVPLPSLFLVVDEFSELLAAHSEFLELFVMIGRLGRSLGVHLLLASQRLDEGRIHALEGHLSYRVGLRTFSVAESRAVLGVGDAYDLPSAPGHGFLRCGTDPLIRFRAGYVSAPYVPPKAGGPAEDPGRHHVIRYRSAYLAPRVAPQAESDAQAPDQQELTSPPVSESTLEVLASRMRGRGRPAHRIWLPPLSTSPTLDALLPEAVSALTGALPEPDPRATQYRTPTLGTAGPVRGLAGPDDTLLAVLGVTDRPFEQRHDPLIADLAGAAGHVAVVGAPLSGKSTLLRTMISSLSLRYTPRDAQFYCLDFGGGGLTALSDLPHVGGVAGRLDGEKVIRTVAEVAMLLAEREQAFAAAGVGSMADYRRRRRAGEFADGQPGLPGIGHSGDVFLVIDGWFTFHQDYERLEPAIQDIAARGLGFGVHLVITAARWTEVRPWLRDLIGTRLELRLGDPIDSEVNAALAKEVPAVPGRGLTSGRLHFLAALPRIDGDPDPATLSEGTRDLVRHITKAHPGQAAPPVRMLPTLLPAARLARPASPTAVALGWDETRLEPVLHEFGNTPHLMVFGENESGKTNLLRLVAKAVTEHADPAQVRVLLADTRRRLHDAVPQAKQLGYAVTAGALEDLLKEITPVLVQRVPGPEVEPARLPLRDWWSGPELYVVVDDYDLMIGGRGTPLAPLLELLPQSAEIGLHLVLARSTAGAARGMNDPVLRRMWELSTPGLLLSCSKDEGVFLGDARPMRLPAGRAQLVSRRSGTLLVQTAWAGEDVA